MNEQKLIDLALSLGAYQAAVIPVHTAPEHMKAFYKTFDEIKNERFDGMIITGAPIEDLDYEDVDYWDELCRIMDYTKENVYSTIHPRARPLRW